MSTKISSLKKIQRENIIHSVLQAFRTPEPERTLEQELQEVIFSWVTGIGIPVASVFVALVVKLNFLSIFSDGPFLLFFSPLIISSYLAGFYSGLLATFLGAFFAYYIFTPPYWQFNTSVKNELLLLLYIVEGIFVSYFIANQKRAKAQAEAIQLSFQLLLENTTDYGIIFFDQRGYITNSNEGVYRLTGYKKQDLLHRFFSLLYTEKDREKKLPEKEFRKALRTGKSSDENYLKRKNGSRFFASGFTTPLWTDNNQLYGFVKLFRDVTETKRLEREKEDFISIAAHELKNPVSSTHLYLQLLQKYYQKHPNKEPQTYVKKASSQLQLLLDLIGTLLDVSQIQKGTITLTKETITMSQLIKDAIETIQASERQHAIFIKGNMGTKVMLDRRKIEEVIINLVNNAIKYSPQAKRVIITIKDKKQDVVVSIKDFGIGMRKDVAAKVFERFYRGEQKQIKNIQGLGLGLYISSQIIHAHGGEMSVSSKLGKGSTFSFRIPKK